MIQDIILINQAEVHTHNIFILLLSKNGSDYSALLFSFLFNFSLVVESFSLIMKFLKGHLKLLQGTLSTFY